MLIVSTWSCLHTKPSTPFGPWRQDCGTVLLITGSTIKWPENVGHGEPLTTTNWARSVIIICKCFTKGCKTWGMAIRFSFAEILGRNKRSKNGTMCQRRWENQRLWDLVAVLTSLTSKLLPLISNSMWSCDEGNCKRISSGIHSMKLTGPHVRSTSGLF